MAIFLKKMKIFGNFFLKKCQAFGNFLTVKWQFSGGSGWELTYGSSPMVTHVPSHTHMVTGSEPPEHGFIAPVFIG